jgi:hypothetical protein
LGFSVAVSGNVLVMGAPGENDQLGAAYVYVAPGGVWKNMSQVAKLTASNGLSGDNFGYSVSISGSTIVAGALYANGGNGAAYVFVKPSTGWKNMTETAELTASDGAFHDLFGTSVGIDGNAIVAGARANNSQGAAYVYVQPVGGWVSMTPTAKLTDSDSVPYFGAAVAISGSTIVVGTSSTSKSAYVFVKPSQGWTNMTETAELKGYYASSVAISGNLIVTGAPTAVVNNLASGAAYVFVKPKNGWVTTSKFNAELYGSDAAYGDTFGTSVSVSGKTVVVGSPLNPCNYVRHGCSPPGPGAAYIYLQPSGGWKGTMAQTYKLTGSDGVDADQFGVSVENSGNAVAIGAKSAGQGVGHGYEFGYISNSGFTSFSVPGSSSTLAYGVNNLGHISGSYNATSTEAGFLDIAGNFTTISYAGYVGQAFGLNDNDEVVGYYANGSTYGFTEQSGLYTTVSYPGSSYTIVWAVNNAGDLVGSYGDTLGGHGFLLSGGVYTTIDPPGSCGTTVSGINNAGQMVGTYSPPPCQTGLGSVGFIYANGIFTYITEPGVYSTTVYGINDNGDLVGNWGPSSPGPGGAFVFWNQTQQFQNFDIGAPGSSSPGGINNLDEIVGVFLNQGSSTRYGYYGHLPGH